MEVNILKMEFSENDIVLYPIHENTKDKRLTIARLENAGVSLWLEGPEISKTFSEEDTAELLCKGSKKANKLFKKFDEKVSKLDLDMIGFTKYQDKVKDIISVYVEKFKEIENND